MIRFERGAPVAVALAALFACAALAQSPKTAQPRLAAQKLPPTPSTQYIVRAYCDDSGAHVVYENNKEFSQKVENGETCSQLAISDDNHSVGWVVAYEATAEDGEGKVIQRWTHENLFVNGVQIDYPAACLYNWRFYDGGRQVVFEAGPLYGGGNMYLYDVETKKIIDQCIKRDPAVKTCPIWASQ